MTLFWQPIYHSGWEDIPCFNIIYSRKKYQLLSYFLEQKDTKNINNKLL